MMYTPYHGKYRNSEYILMKLGTVIGSKDKMTIICKIYLRKITVSVRLCPFLFILDDQLSQHLKCVNAILCLEYEDEPISST
jgi:hypothetical protein